MNRYLTYITVKPINIAIADDHKYLRLHICETLCSYGHIVMLEATNGKELIDGVAALDRLPDICIVDINMPVMDGFTTTREIKKRWPEIKILGYSINNEKSIIAEMYHCGADCFLNKNADPQILNETVYKLIIKN